MIIEMRTYTVDPHKLRPWLALWEKTVLPIQLDHITPLGGSFLGMYLNEFGTLNEVVHLWQHRDLQARSTMLGQVERDPRWAGYLKAVNELAPMLAMRNSILRATAFSPQSLSAAPAAA